jgi:DinB superfamily
VDTASAVASDLELVLNRQFETAWKLAEFHLESLTTEECLWRPSPIGPHVRRLPDGRWQADWPEREDYGAGAPSIAWLTWHVGFWWSMVLDHSLGAATLKREDIWWPGDAAGVRAWIEQLRNEWRHALSPLTAAELAKSERTRWPFRDRPFADVIAWVSVELTKNAAEIGYARFLYATRTR